MRFSSLIAAAVLLLDLSVITQGRALQFPGKNDICLSSHGPSNCLGEHTPFALDSTVSKRAPPRLSRPGQGQDGFQNGGGAQTGGGKQTGGNAQTGGGKQEGGSPTPDQTVNESPKGEANPVNEVRPPPELDADGLPKPPPCNGKRGLCIADETDWNNLNIGGQGGVREKGADELRRLDNIKTDPSTADPRPKDLTQDYKVKWEEFKDVDRDLDVETVRTAFDIDVTEFKKANGKPGWMMLKLNNRDGDLEALLRKQKTDDPGLTEDDIARRRAAYTAALAEDSILTAMYNSEAKGIVIQQSQARDLDILRKNEEPGDPIFKRPEGLDEARASRWSDQVMYGWKRHVEESKMDLKNAELEWVLRRYIQTEETINVIEAALKRAGRELDEDTVITPVRRDDPNPLIRDAFEAIAGTVHGHRVISMLKDYHATIGDRTVTAFHVARAQYAFGDRQIDMVIEIKRQP